MMRGTETAHSFVKGDSQWKEIATNGWQDNWPDYDQAGITMDSKIYFFGMFMAYVNIIWPRGLGALASTTEIKRNLLA